MILVDGIPAHPLVVHAVVVLLPLAAVGALVVAVRPAWRRSFGIPVLLIAVVGVGAVPIAAETGEQLEHALPAQSNPLIEVHAQRGSMLLPFAVTFLLLLAAAVLMGRIADRGLNEAPTRATVTRSRIAVGLAGLAAIAGITVAGLVIWIGQAGAAAVWQGVGQ